MKKILSIVLISISLISWSQDKTKFEKKVDSITSLQQQNHYYLDTLWVMDSSQKYVYSNYQNEISELERIYKVISRNDNGNVLISSDFHPGGYQQATEDNWIDTISYFDGSNISKHTKYIWNSDIDNWQIYEFEEFETSGLLKETYKIDYSNVFQYYSPSWRYSYENSNVRVDVETVNTYNSNSNTWEPNSKLYYYYDEFGNDTLFVRKFWINNGWRNESMKRKTFVQGLMESSISMKFNPTNNTWENYRKSKNSHNEDGLVDTLWQWDWNTEGNLWAKTSIAYCSYDNLKRYKYVLQTKYNSTTQQIENYANIQFDYSNNNYVETWQVWLMPEGYWLNNKRNTNSFIYDDKYDTIQQELWLQDQERWYIKYRTVNEYDHRENLCIQKNYYVNYITYEPYIMDSTSYFWSAFVANSVNELKHNLISVYPNPASTHINFKFNEPQQGNSTLHIYNLAGQKIDEILLSKEVSTWDCSGVKPGIYIYSVISDGNKVTGKVVVR